MKENVSLYTCDKCGENNFSKKTMFSANIIENKLFDSCDEKQNKDYVQHFCLECLNQIIQRNCKEGCLSQFQVFSVERNFKLTFHIAKI